MWGTASAFCAERVDVGGEEAVLEDIRAFLREIDEAGIFLGRATSPIDLGSIYVESAPRLIIRLLGAKTAIYAKPITAFAAT